MIVDDESEITDSFSGILIGAACGACEPDLLCP